ncbi:MAG TPA: hypothetical protein VGO79_09840 [Thermoanaerobaculia bacterium]|jgi:hypothetical protein
MSIAVLVAAGVAAVGVAIVLVAVLPRVLVRRSQDRLAAKLLEEKGGGFRLLTRAEMVAGTYRRLPGVLGLTEEAVAFRGLFGESEIVATPRIQKIATGRRMAGGRRLLRLEVLRLTRTDGSEVEFVLAPDSASAWRSHLGLWAVRERTAAMDTVAPGRK